MSSYHADYISSINEVKQWLSYKSLDEFIYLLLDHGYDDLASISQCTDAELADLVTLFSTQESKQSIRRLVEAIRQVGIDVYRKQKTEFRRLIDLDRVEEKQEQFAKQVSRVRSETLGKAASGLLTAAIQASQAATAASAATPVLSAASSTSPAGSKPSAATTPSKTTPAASSPTSASTTPAVAGVANSPGTASLLAVQTSGAGVLKNTPASPTHGPIKLPPALSAAAAASATAAQANPTASFDVASWEGAIHFQAYLHSIQCYARAFDEPILAPHALEIKLLDGRTNVHLKKIQQSLHELTDGCIFKKFKRGSSSTRLIWCSSAFDFVVWGDPDKSLIKGYINTHDIQEVNQGFASKNKNRLYIVSPERTLELEAKDGQQAREWKEKLELLIQLNMSELEQKQALQQSTGSGGSGGSSTTGTSSAFQSKFAKARAEYTKLICTGSVFKKWPGAGKLGSFTTRLVWSPPAVDRLQWGDLMNKKVMGFVLIQDIVEVRAHPDDKLKFTLFACKRSLDLEARNEQTREKWIKALRFFVEFHLNMKLISKHAAQ